MPKGGKSSLVPVRAGLRKDLDTFLQAFLKIGSTRYCDFKNLFASTGMTSLFNGRSYYAEIIEFNECLLSMCLRYLNVNISAKASRCLNERLFGIYALYTFYYLQQADHVVKIPMDPDMCQSFCQLSEFLKSSGHLDAYALTLQLVEDKAFKIDAFISNFDPSCYKQFDTDENLDNVKVYANVHVPMANVRNMLKSDVFLKINACHKEYKRMKQDANLTSLFKTETNPIDEIWRILNKYEKESEKSSSVKLKSALDKNDEPSRGRSRLSIKDAAYSSALVFTRNRRYRDADNALVATNSFAFAEEEEKEEAQTAAVDIPNSDDNINNIAVDVTNAVNDLGNVNMIEDSVDQPVYVKTVTKKRGRKAKTEPQQPPKKRATTAKNKQPKKPKVEVDDSTDVNVQPSVDYPKAATSSKSVLPSALPVKPKGRATMNSLSAEYFEESIKQTEWMRRRVKFDMKLKIREIPNRSEIVEEGDLEENEEEEAEEVDSETKMEEVVCKIEEVEEEKECNVVEGETVENKENEKNYHEKEIKIEPEDEEMEEYQDSNVEVMNLEKPGENVSNTQLNSEWSEEPPTDVGDDNEFSEPDDDSRPFDSSQYDNDYFLPFESDDEQPPAEGEEDEADLAIDE